MGTGGDFWCDKYFDCMIRNDHSLVITSWTGVVSDQLDLDKVIANCDLEVDC